MTIDKLLKRLKKYIPKKVKVNFDYYEVDRFFREINPKNERKIKISKKIRYPRWSSYFSKKFKEKNVSVEEFSRDAGISTDMIYSYLKGEYFPTSKSTKKKICGSFGITEKYLKSLED